MKTLNKVLAFNLGLALLLTSFSYAKAGLSDSTALSLTIGGGGLDVSAQNDSVDLGSLPFSFAGQTATSSFGDVIVTDSRGSRVGWTVDITATNWDDGAGHNISYNGDGTTTGRLGLNIPEISAVAPGAGGDGLSGITMGADDAFSTSKSSINLISAASGYGSGAYTVSGLAGDQFIPGNQPAGTYNTTLTLTAS